MKNFRSVGRGEDRVTLGRVRSVDRHGFQLMMHFCNYHFPSLCPIIRNVMLAPSFQVL
jgi:hypothetical protein